MSFKKGTLQKVYAEVVMDGSNRKEPIMVEKNQGGTK